MILLERNELAASPQEQSKMVKMNATLADLPVGETATIRDIDTSTPTGNRLLELGFIPGTPITAVQRAPMGDPATYAIRGYRIGLRRSESALVSIHAA